MTFEDRLRLHLAGKGAAWRSEGAFTYAVWDEDGAHAAALLAPPVSAASVVDAYVARPAGARLTLVHDGPLSPVALRSAARFGITLLDAATLPEIPAPAVEIPLLDAAPEPAPLMLPPHEAAPLLPAHVESELPTPALVAPEPTTTPAELAPEPAAPLDLPVEAPAPLDAPFEAPATVEIPVVEPAVELPVAAPEPVEIPVMEAAVEMPVAAPEPVEIPVLAPVVEMPVATPEPVVEAAQPADEILIIAPAPEPLASVTVTAPPVEDGPALPWDPRVVSAPPVATIDVSADELAALPWHDHAPLEEHVELMQGNPRPRRFGLAERPTITAADWGLPWPRPTTAPTPDALSLNDPRIWHNTERVHAVRENLDARSGAASFGALRRHPDR